MGEALDALLVKLTKVRVPVVAHPRTTEHGVTQVRAHIRTIDVSPKAEAVGNRSVDLREEFLKTVRDRQLLQGKAEELVKQGWLDEPLTIGNLEERVRDAEARKAESDEKYARFRENMRKSRAEAAKGTMGVYWRENTLDDWEAYVGKELLPPDYVTREDVNRAAAFTEEKTGMPSKWTGLVDTKVPQITGTPIYARGAFHPNGTLSLRPDYYDTPPNFGSPWAGSPEPRKAYVGAERPPVFLGRPGIPIRDDQSIQQAKAKAYQITQAVLRMKIILHEVAHSVSPDPSPKNSAYVEFAAFEEGVVEGWAQGHLEEFLTDNPNFDYDLNDPFVGRAIERSLTYAEWTDALDAIADRLGWERGAFYDMLIQLPLATRRSAILQLAREFAEGADDPEMGAYIEAFVKEKLKVLEAGKPLAGVGSSP
jgi:hypothetical protein